MKKISCKILSNEVLLSTVQDIGYTAEIVDNEVVIFDNIDDQEIGFLECFIANNSEVMQSDYAFFHQK